MTLDAIHVTPSTVTVHDQLMIPKAYVKDQFKLNLLQEDLIGHQKGFAELTTEMVTQVIGTFPLSFSRSRYAVFYRTHP